MLNETHSLAAREPVSRQVYRILRKAIIKGELPAETRIVEGDFAKVLGVSRTPLREALSRLEIDGLVSLSPGAGYSVTNTRAQLGEIFDLRKAIEGYAARLAAENATPDLVGKLRRTCEKHAALKLSESTRRAKLNTEFHNLITEACPSRMVRERVHELREFNFGPGEMEIHPDLETVQAFLDEHRGMVAAIEAGDGDAADRLTRTHLDRALQLLLSARKDPDD